MLPEAKSETILPVKNITINPPPKKNIKSKYHKSLAGGWATPLKNMMKVSWDEEIPNWMETHVPNHQPDAYTLYITMENHNF